jgi:CrcB protein
MHHAIRNSLLVGTGGFFGSALRYLLAAVLHKSSPALPIGTLAANVLGCFIIGIICHTVPMGRALNENMRMILALGFCGGLTTASSFIQQTANMHRTGNSAHAASYLALTIALSFVAFYAGLYVSKLIVKN